LKYRSDIKEEQLVALGYTPTAETTTTSSTQVAEQTTKQTTTTEPLVSVTEKIKAETTTTSSTQVAEQTTTADNFKLSDDGKKTDSTTNESLTTVSETTTTEITQVFEVDETELISYTLRSQLTSTKNEVDELDEKIEELNDKINFTKDKKEKATLEAEVINYKKQLEDKEQELNFLETKQEAVIQAEANIKSNPKTTYRLSQTYESEADELILTSSNLRKNADLLADSAETIKKSKDKELILDEVSTMRRTADEQQKQADTKYALAKEIKMAEDQVLAIIASQTVSDVAVSEEKETPSTISQTPEYNTYVDLVVESQELQKQSQLNQQQVETIDLAANDIKNQLASISELLSNTNDSEEVERLSSQTSALEERLKKLMMMLDSLQNETNKLHQLALNKQKEADSYLSQIDETKAKEILAYQQQAESNIENESTSFSSTATKSSAVESSTSTISEPLTIEKAVEMAYETPKVLMNEIFVKETASKTSPYSQSKPIPVNIKQPDGLVYKVQIGAFRNPIPQDLFKGFAPITGEKTDSGLTRYLAGLFNNINSANNAKDAIRELGYNDAFVVAYYNGERISIAEARRLSDGQAIASTNTTKNANQTSTSSSPTTSQQATVAKSEDVAKINGLFYTVQVGVYTQQVPPSRLYNISPLNSEKLENGNYRYSSGIYNSVGEANNAKNNIVNVGITDAFVTAYYQGKRISVAEANKLLAENGNNILAGGSSSNATPNNTNIVFKIHLGAFESEVPIDVGSIILANSSKGIEVKKTAEGKSVYLLGNYKDLSSAEQMLKEINQNNINAKIVAFDNFVEITLEDAKRKLNQ
jgi:myosin heavy subunit